MTDAADHGAVSLRTWAIEAEAAAGIADALVDTAFIPDTLRRWKPGRDPKRRPDSPELDRDATRATVAAALLTGMELGFTPMAALRAIDIIRGTPALRAHALRALLLAHGHEIVVVETTTTRARVRARRGGTEHWQESAWTLQRAKDAGLFPGGNDSQWRRQPTAMLVARATAEVARWVASDAMLGLPLIAEEIIDGDDAYRWVPEQGERVEPPDPNAPPAARRATQSGRKTARKRTAPARAALPSGPPLAAPEPPAEPAPASPAAAPEPPTVTSVPEVEFTEPVIMISASQRGRMWAELRAIGVTDREEARRMVGEWIGREIQSSNDLTAAEAHRVLDTLAALVDEGQEGGDSDADDGPADRGN